jgi:hypothetical protein
MPAVAPFATALRAADFAGCPARGGENDQSVKGRDRMRTSRMVPLELARLTDLMERTSGRPDVTIGLIDGPVATRHPDLAGGRLQEIHERDGAACTQTDSAACVHGTFVAGILSARRQSSAPGICPREVCWVFTVHAAPPRTAPVTSST